MSRTVLRRNPEVVWRDEPDQKAEILAALERGEEVADRGWVILVDGGEMVELNLLAGEIWCLLDGSRDLEAVVSRLADGFDAPREEIREDVEALAADFQRRGWLLEEAS